MSDPAWEHLPHNPQAFFELPDEFDRKELKRSYNKLIRRYKPEKFPAEFQQIRSAFENLDQMLRYGQLSQFNVPAPTYQWNTEEVAAETTQARAPRPPSLRKRLRKESPRRIYKDLQSRKQKSPYEYFVLALLADVVTQDKDLFLKWLLTGLQQHPSEPGLLALLREYYQSEIPATSLASILVTTSKVIQDDRYYFLTEKLWERLLAAVSFDEFQRTLSRCEKNLQDYRIEGRLAFYIRMLRRALWKADDDWVDQTFAFIDENNSEMSDVFEVDVELLLLAREYRTHRESIIGKDPVRRRIDKALIAYMTLSEEEGDASVIDCQSSLVNASGSLLESFPDENEHYGLMYHLWSWISGEVCYRHDLDEPTNSKLVGQVYQLMRDLDRSDVTTTSRMLTYLAVTKGPYLLFFTAPFILMWPWIFNPIVAVTALTIGVAGVGFHVMWFSEKVAINWFSNYMQRTLRRRYKRNWRPRFTQLLDATRASHVEVIYALEEVITERHDELGVSTWLIHFVPEDYGLAFYSIATRFVR